MITYLGLKSKARPNNYKRARYNIVNVSKKGLSKIIREFDKLTYNSYERRRPKHDPDDSYCYPARQISNYLMISDALNFHVLTG